VHNLPSFSPVEKGVDVYHIWSWLAWLVAAALPAFMLRNPLYLVLVVGAAWIVYAILGRSSPMGASWGAFVKFGFVLFALTVLFNVVSIHIGRIVLFRLPTSWPIIGGPITLEAIIAGAVNGMALLTIVVVFAAFNSVVDHYQLLRATPPFLFQAGVVVSIAITFVPQMVLSAKQIREAQRIRGHRFRGIRDLLPFVIPLLANGLDRAIQLAETMEARGFASVVEPASQQRSVASQLISLAGLVAILAGLVLATFAPNQGIAGWLLAGLGLTGLLAVFGLQSKSVHRTRYRRPKWRARDTAILGASLLVIAVVLAARATVPESLVYSPYPPNTLLPGFNPVVGAALLLLSLPALLAPRTSSTQQAAGQTEYVT
jgi:energy-coupling factor transport system permease protein